jgi:hypothetical protein
MINVKFIGSMNNLLRVARPGSIVTLFFENLGGSNTSKFLPGMIL